WVVLCRTDVPHSRARPPARRRDAAPLRSVLARAPDAIGPGDACGRYALRGLLAWAMGLTPCLLDYRTSAQASGDPARVVGYAAQALRQGGVARGGSGKGQAIDLRLGPRRVRPFRARVPSP